MAQIYKMVKMPIEAHELFKLRKLRMEKSIENIIGKRIPVKMANVYRLSAKAIIEVPHDVLIKAVKKRGVKI
jgi:hypothetical protein